MGQLAEVGPTGEGREVLERWARRPTSAQALALRCRIVLAAAEGHASTEIAAELGCNHNTVSKWRGRFARRGFDGLHDEPRPGKPRTITDEQVERVIVKTLEEQPRDATHWSTRSMAAATGMSQSAVSRIWRAFGLKPHQTETFKLSPDPQLIDKVRDIVGLYLNPPEAAVVFCVDEKAQIQAFDRSAPILPLMPGVPQRQSHDYVRNCTTNLYAALDVASGQVISEMTPRHRAEEFRRFLNLIDGSAVWLQATAQALARAGCAVTVVLKAPVRTDRLTAPLQAEPGVVVTDPHRERLLPGNAPAGPPPAAAVPVVRRAGPGCPQAWCPPR